VVERYTAHVRIISSDDLLKLDQDDLETVIPAVGGTVRIVNGARCRGAEAELTSLDTENFCVGLLVRGGEADGTRLEGVEYEDVCKLAF